MEQNPFKKILFLITSAGEAKETIRKVHGLARVCHAKLIILNVIDKMQIQRMKRFTNQSTTEIEVEMEENNKSFHHISTNCPERLDPDKEVYRSW